MPVLKVKKNGIWEEVSGSATVELDNTLTEEGKAADAKAVGDALANINFPITSVNGQTGDVQLAATDVGAATEDYVDTKIAAMVDSAPETLDTLNELAAALGDDPNFATTVATKIGTLEDLVGDTPVAEQIANKETYVNVASLPLMDINDKIAYRVLEGTFVGQKRFRYDAKCHVVEVLPETGESALVQNGDDLSYVGYYNLKNNEAYAYINQSTKDLLITLIDASSLNALAKIAAKAVVNGMATGWKTFAEFINLVGSAVSISWGGVVYTLGEITNENALYIFVGAKTYYRNNGVWTSGDYLIGRRGTDSDAETFNDLNNIASAPYAHAEGSLTTASGSYSHAEGYRTEASGLGAHSEGQDTQATGGNAHAEGNGTTSSGTASHAEGVNTIATTWGAHAEGGATQATNQYTHAEGYNTEATNNFAHAEGNGTVASGVAAHSEGQSTRAIGQNSHAEGYNTEASYYYSHAEGANTISSGEASHAEGLGAEASGAYSHAEGQGSKAETSRSHAEGHNTVAKADAAHSEGKSTTAEGVASHAEGTNTIASGENAHAEGSGTKATKQHTHAEGYNTSAEAWGAHAEGGNSHALGEYAHAEGLMTNAYGEGAHAEGRSTQAFGDASHAEGRNTKTGYAHGFTVVKLESKRNDDGMTSSYTGYLYLDSIDGIQSGDQITLVNFDQNHSSIAFNVSISTYNNCLRFDNGINPEGSNLHIEKIPSISEESAISLGTYCYLTENPYTGSRILSHSNAHSSGLGTITGRDNQTAIGQYNQIDTNALFVVGDGTSDEQRSNSFVVYENGEATLAGVNIVNTNVLNNNINGVNNRINTEIQTINNKFVEAETSVNTKIDAVNTQISAVEEKIVGKKIANGGEIFNSYDGTGVNFAGAPGSHAEGVGTLAGAKAFVITNSVQAIIHVRLTLNVVDGLSTGLKVTLLYSSVGVEYPTKIVSGSIYSINTDNNEVVVTVGRNTTFFSNLELYTGLNYLLIKEESDIEATVLGSNSHTSGKYTIAIGDNQTVIGQYNELDDDALFIVGNGDGQYTRNNAFAVHKDGSAEIYFVNGENPNSVVNVEYLNTMSPGAGQKTTDGGEIFNSATLAKKNAHAEGRETKAYGAESHAEGLRSETSEAGKYAHAEGYETKAYGEASHTEGINTKATGGASHAGGVWTVADGYAQTVVGRYNKTGTNSLFVVGDGTGVEDTNRADAFTVNKDGTITTGKEDFILTKSVDTKDKAIEFCSLFADATGDAGAFLFFTDAHFFHPDNNKYNMDSTIKYIQRYYEETPTSFVLNGGDMLQSGDTKAEACYKLGYANGKMNSAFDKYYYVFGNHDNNYQGANYAGNNVVSSADLLTQNCVRNLCMRDQEKAYYTFKDGLTRYYVFDTGIDWDANAMSTYKWEQVDWFARQLIANDDMHNVIIAHQMYYADNSICELAINLTKIAQSYNNSGVAILNDQTYGFTATKGTVHYYLAGHSHKDANTTVNNIPCIMTTNAYASSWTEPTFDLVLADYARRKLHCVRVGSGSSRTINIV